MILHNDSSFKIYFGDNQDRCVKSDSIKSQENFLKIKDKLKLESLVFLNQIHSYKGYCINDSSKIKNSLDLFNIDGDYVLGNINAEGISANIIANVLSGTITAGSWATVTDNLESTALESNLDYGSADGTQGAEFFV